MLFLKIYTVYLSVLFLFVIFHYCSIDDKYTLIVKQPKRATNKKRAASAIIDLLRGVVILFVLSVLLHIIATLALSFDDNYLLEHKLNTYEHILITLTNIIFIAAVVANQNIHPSQTYGKRLLKVRLVKQDGSSVTWKCSFLRTLLIIATCPFIVLEFLLERNKMVHDEISNTIIVQQVDETKE